MSATEANPPAYGIERTLAHENAEALEREPPEEDFPNVPLEEFLYYAKLEREYEKVHSSGNVRRFLNKYHLFPSKLIHREKDTVDPANISESNSEKNGTGDENGIFNDDKRAAGDLESAVPQVNSDLTLANRAGRNATYLAVFFLITTDILGPSSAPYAVSQLGFAPGALLYFLMGIGAAYTGYLLWGMFLTLDSSVYPLKNYGDVVSRIYGRRTRFAVDILQSIQLLCNVAVIILGNGQGLSEIAKGKGCYTILILVWALAGMIVTQIKTLQKFGHLANLAVWMNLFVCFATMGMVAHSPPNYVAAAGTSLVGVNGNAPVVTHAVISGAGGNFKAQLNATMNIVYAYGGAMVFIEFMAEMKRPMDFIKGMAMAQSLIFTCYLLYGLFVYAYQGQYVVNPANQGVSVYGWQTALNIISLLSALIAAGLYGNVGIKVVYNTFVRKVFHGPDLNSKKAAMTVPGIGLELNVGRVIWIPTVVVYWGIAYVVATAIPNFSALTGLVGAVCILQFTYTFPPIMKFGLDFQLSAMKADGPYDPVTKQSNRIDTWKDASRWIRAYRDRWALHTFHILFFLASAATAALGIFSSAELLASSFKTTTLTSFTCISPVA